MNTNPILLYRKNRRPKHAFKKNALPPAVLNNKLEALKVLANSILFELSSLENEGEIDARTDVDLVGEVQRFEEHLIRSALTRTGGRQRTAAALLGIKPTTLNSKMKRYGMIEDGNIDYQGEEDEDI